MSFSSLPPLLESARLLADAGAWVELETLLERHATSSPPDGEVALLYVEALIRRGDERRALGFLD